MMLEAVWLKNGKEVYKVSPVLNLLCEDDMNNVNDIEVEDEHRWHDYRDFHGDADDFVIRVKRN